jgi:dihydroxyacetone kinase-like predicted kinase
VSAPGRATGERGRFGDASLVRVRAALAAGLESLEGRRAQINALDATEGADGDTGDNMVRTLRAVLAELDRLAGPEGRTVDEIGRAEIVASVARAALLGARGRAGVILSQLVRGAAEELAGRRGELIDPVLIGAALARAADQAYGSVREPTEGTMLTVVRELALAVEAEIVRRGGLRLAPDATASEQDQLIAGVIRAAVRAGGDSLARDPERLARLRQAATADAGGYGIIVLITGIADALGDEGQAVDPERRPPSASS